MTLEELVTHYPRLYHMAAGGSWPSIHVRGLLTTRQLVDICNPTPEQRDAALRCRRRDNIRLQLPEDGEAVVRDQAPLRPEFIAKCLEGMSFQEWLDLLNSQVYFWLHADKLAELLAARRYRNHSHDVLTVDTASLYASHAVRVRLSAINSGATLYPNAPQRGPETFRRLLDYPFAQRRKGRSLREAVVELAVIDGVPDINMHVIRVERRRRDEILEVLLSRD